MFDFGTIKKGELIPALAAASFLLFASQSHWPYAFYVLLRVAVCTIGIYLALTAFVAGRVLWVWLIGAVAVVFNPIVPVRMHRSDWGVLNDIAAFLFIFWAVASLVRGMRGRRNLS